MKEYTPTSVRIKKDLLNRVSEVADNREWSKHKTILKALELGLEVLHEPRNK